MSKFKVGDRVNLLKSSEWFGEGCNPSNSSRVGEVIKIRHAGWYNVKWEGARIDAYQECDLKKANPYPNPPHKHAEVIKAWADGAVIQVKTSSKGDWKDRVTPKHLTTWPDGTVDRFDHYEYRVKPSPTPVEEEKASIVAEMEELKQRLDRLEV